MANRDAFKERFNRWKQGLPVYKAGKVICYDEGKDEEDSYSVEDANEQASLQYLSSLVLDNRFSSFLNRYDEGKDVAGSHNFNAIPQISQNAGVSYQNMYDTLTGDLFIDSRQQQVPMFKKGSDRYEAFVDDVIREEGFLKQPENIGDGVWTIGSGLTKKKWHDLYKARGNKWSEADNRAAVKEELENTKRDLRRVFPSFDTFPVQAQEVLMDIQYNTGAVSKKRSPNFVKHVLAEDWAAAANDMDWGNKDEKFGNGLRQRNERRQRKWLTAFAGQLGTKRKSDLVKQMEARPTYTPKEPVHVPTPTQYPIQNTVPQAISSWSSPDAPSVGRVPYEKFEIRPTQVVPSIVDSYNNMIANETLFKPWIVQ